jgi:hypothetical protein
MNKWPASFSILPEIIISGAVGIAIQEMTNDFVTPLFMGEFSLLGSYAFGIAAGVLTLRHLIGVRTDASIR